MAEVRESGLVRIIKQPQRTFAFVANGESERFFHWSDYDKTSDKPFHHLQVGDKVTYVAAERDGKPVATNVHFKYTVDTRKPKAKK